MNWEILIFVIIAAAVLLVFVIIKNQKDKKQLEEKIKEDYPKPKDEGGGAEANETMK